MEEYAFEQLWKELDEGHQVYYTYMNRRYLLTKITKNCYLRELITVNEKESQQKKATITLKSVKEMFPFMENKEYKI